MKKEKGLPVNKKERAVSAKFAVMIKQARLKKGYSLAQLAELIDSSPSYIQRLESYERRNPSISLFLLLADALELDIWDMLHVAIGDKDSEPKSIEMVLLQNNYSLKGLNEVSVDAKVCFADIVELIVNKMDKSCDFKDLLQVGEMIRRFHEILDKEKEVKEGA